jgi:hypothetical protein
VITLTKVAISSWVLRKIAWMLFTKTKIRTSNLQIPLALFSVNQRKRAVCPQQQDQTMVAAAVEPLVNRR